MGTRTLSFPSAPTRIEPRLSPYSCSRDRPPRAVFTGKVTDDETEKENRGGFARRKRRTRQRGKSLLLVSLLGPAHAPRMRACARKSSLIRNTLRWMLRILRLDGDRCLPDDLLVLLSFFLLRRRE